MCGKCDEVEQAISESYQHIFENTTELTLVEKPKQLGKTIVQLQDTNWILNAMVQPMTSSKRVVERKASIEEIETRFEKHGVRGQDHYGGNNAVLVEHCPGRAA